MFKRSIVLLLLVFLVVFSVPLPALASSPVSVTIDGDPLSFDVPPTIVEGRTLVPLRAIFEALGAIVDWEGVTRTITATKGQQTIILTIDSKVAFKNQQEIDLDVPATIIEGRTLVPTRFIAESLGAVVDWDGKTRTVKITKSGTIPPAGEQPDSLKTEDIVKIASPATVFVMTSVGTGSGFIIKDDGKIVTTYHVIEGSSWVSVRLADGRTFDVSSIYYYDKNRDIAILNIDGNNLPTVKLGNSDAILAGQNIVVIGSPLGLEATVTKGIISNPDLQQAEQASILIDAAVSPGNSGGPLLNDRAEVVGVIYAGLVYGETLNLAIPINEVKLHLGTDRNLSVADVTGIHKTPDTPGTTIVEHLILDTGNIYSGEMQNNNPNGWGSLVTIGDDVVLGEWQDGWLQGIGVVWAGGGADIRIGRWQAGEPVGIEGWFRITADDMFLVNGGCEVLNYDCGAEYVGEVRNGLPHGWGAQLWANGDLYAGEWRNGNRHGIGMYSWGDGDKFVGEWQNGDWTEFGAWFNCDGTLWR